MDDIEVPDDILQLAQTEFKKSNDKLGSSEYKSKGKKSAFILTVNPNLGKKILANVEQVKIEYKKLYKINKELEQRFRAGQFLKLKPLSGAAKLAVEKKRAAENKQQEQPEQWVPPPVVDYQANIEAGSKNGFLHIQGLLQLDGTAHVDCDAIVKWLQDNYYAHRCYAHARWAQISTKETLLDYIHKGSAQKKPTALTAPAVQTTTPSIPQRPDNLHVEPTAQPTQPTQPTQTTEHSKSFLSAQLKPKRVRKTATNQIVNPLLPQIKSLFD